MTKVEIKKVLTEGIVTFRYTKNDCSIRTARGTLNKGIIPVPTGGICYPKKAGYIPYFDMDKHKWRCFYPSTFELISVAAV